MLWPGLLRKVDLETCIVTRLPQFVSTAICHSPLAVLEPRNWKRHFGCRLCTKASFQLRMNIVETPADEDAHRFMYTKCPQWGSQTVVTCYRQDASYTGKTGRVKSYASLQQGNDAGL